MGKEVYADSRHPTQRLQSVVYHRFPRTSHAPLGTRFAPLTGGKEPQLSPRTRAAFQTRSSARPRNTTQHTQALFSVAHCFALAAPSFHRQPPEAAACLQGTQRVAPRSTKLAQRRRAPHSRAAQHFPRTSAGRHLLPPSARGTLLSSTRPPTALWATVARQLTCPGTRASAAPSSLVDSHWSFGGIAFHAHKRTHLTAKTQPIPHHYDNSQSYNQTRIHAIQRRETSHQHKAHHLYNTALQGPARGASISALNDQQLHTQWYRSNAYFPSFRHPRRRAQHVLRVKGFGLIVERSSITLAVELRYR